MTIEKNNTFGGTDIVTNLFPKIGILSIEEQEKIRTLYTLNDSYLNLISILRVFHEKYSMTYSPHMYSNTLEMIKILRAKDEDINSRVVSYRKLTVKTLFKILNTSLSFIMGFNNDKGELSSTELLVFLHSLEELDNYLNKITTEFINKTNSRVKLALSIIQYIAEGKYANGNHGIDKLVPINVLLGNNYNDPSVMDYRSYCDKNSKDYLSIVRGNLDYLKRTLNVHINDDTLVDLFIREVELFIIDKLED